MKRRRRTIETQDGEKKNERGTTQMMKYTTYYVHDIG
jgi:hypothetical protein